MARHSRRSFLARAAAVPLSCCTPNQLEVTASPFGQLQPDPAGILNLPAGFQYHILSRTGDLMNDGYLVPSACDGMAAFDLGNGKVALIRNHELNPNDDRPTAFGSSKPREFTRSTITYDTGKRNIYPDGGTSTLIYDMNTRQVIDQRMSLMGTVRNCAGGPTPWGTWITCEEEVIPAGGPLAKHGYCFEVHPTQGGNPNPIKRLGFFRHEAIAFLPQGHIAYLTEDRWDSVFYRYLLDKPHEIHGGGKLQALALLGYEDTTNHLKQSFPIRQQVTARWIDIDDPDPEGDTLRSFARTRGAAVFCRGEGVTCDGSAIFFACTEGGHKKLGQIFRYVPSPAEGTPAEADSPGHLELFVESDDPRMMAMCDNLCMAPTGDLVVAEDSKNNSQRLLGVNVHGKVYPIAEHIANRSELAGCTWSPDGSTLFFNVFHPGVTMAITGPWPAV